ncbi:hypothetical protein, partial [Laceyella sediminis]|uniref:hypothetical protein n=1 Tax=Laceyella sediminis TaxID=573074 RepID=UPI001C635547
AMLLSRAGKGGGFKFIWVDIHPLIVYIPFIYKNPAINKVDSQGLSTFSRDGVPHPIPLSSAHRLDPMPRQTYLAV